jgi:uncharacterized membrane protein
VPNDRPLIDKLNYLTQRAYRYKQFESGSEIDDDGLKDDARPYAKLDPEGVTTKTEFIEVFTSRNRPELVFWYADAPDQTTKFKLIYNSLIGYMDLNNNGIFDFGEEQFITSLENSRWELKDLTNSISSDYGNYVQFQLTSGLYFTKYESDRLITDRPEFYNELGTITFTFLITDQDFSPEGSTPSSMVYKINGQTELKIDISIEFFKPVDIDGICLEQLLYDETMSYGFKPIETGKAWEYFPRRLADSSTPYDIDLSMQEFVPITDTPKQKIMFVDDAGKEFGFYSWVNNINITYFNGLTEDIEIKTTYLPDGAELKIYTNYPYSESVSELHHEPSVGMIKENKPKPIEPGLDLADILFSPWIYVLASITAVIVFLAMGYSGRKKKKQDSELGDQRYSDDELEFAKANKKKEYKGKSRSKQKTKNRPGHKRKRAPEHSDDRVNEPLERF